MKAVMIPATTLASAVLFVVGLVTPIVLDTSLLDFGSLYTMIYVVVPLAMAVMAILGGRRHPILVHIAHGLGWSLAGLTLYVVASARAGASWFGFDLLEATPVGAGFYSLLVAAIAVCAVSVGGAAHWRTGAAPTEWETKASVGVAACCAVSAVAQLWPSKDLDLWDFRDIGMLAGALTWLLGVPVLVGLAAGARSRQGFAFAVGAGSANVVIYISVSQSELAGPAWPRDVIFLLCNVAVVAVSLWGLGPLRWAVEWIARNPGAASESRPKWAPDPWRRHSERFWNGREWTAQIRNGAALGFDPPPTVAPSLPPPPPPPRLPPPRP